MSCPYHIPRNFNSPFLIQIISVHFHWNIVVAQVICLWYFTHSLGLKGIPSMSLSEDFPIKTSAPRVTGIIGVFMYHIVSRFPLQVFDFQVFYSSIHFKYFISFSWYFEDLQRYITVCRNWHLNLKVHSFFLVSDPYIMSINFDFFVWGYCKVRLKCYKHYVCNRISVML